MALSALTIPGSNCKPCKYVSLNPSKICLQLNFPLAGPPNACGHSNAPEHDGKCNGQGSWEEADLPRVIYSKRLVVGSDLWQLWEGVDKAVWAAAAVSGVHPEIAVGRRDQQLGRGADRRGTSGSR